MNPLLQLIEHGQSYWMDNLSRAMIENGELERRVAEEGLRGITSNPTIFNKAISGGSDYDEQIKELVHEKRPVEQIYEALTVKDVQDACDILRPVYDDSDGVDGFVSLEVSPYLAHDAEATMQEALRLYKAVGRPNVFIKIPGTAAGLPAIEQMLYEGVNINITLLFSIERYEAVAWAYIRALERRAAEGKSLRDVASVASFFLSRIDVLVDQLLGHHIKPNKSDGAGPRPERLLGRVAVANAKLAYQSFKEIFSGERWEKLEKKGARVQRPLWASTSTKNPLYQDVRYVEPLIGPNTVNTMPGDTIDAFADHGVVVPNSVEQDVDEARQILSDLEEVGVNLGFVTSQLVNEGVQKFITPFDALMKTLANKRQEFLAKEAPHQTITYGQLKGPITEAFGELDSQQFARRLFATDPYLWTSDHKEAEKIRNRLGWVHSVEMFQEKVGEINEFAQSVKDANFRHVVLLGMGGSSLCPEVCRQTFGSAPGWPEIIMLDNTDPDAVRAVESEINVHRTLFLVASKSGTTTETISFYKYFYQQMREKTDRPGDHFVAITDPGTPLAKQAREQKFRAVFENPEDIGGRYSALSYFGLVPMALLGLDVGNILRDAREMQVACGAFVPSEANPGVSLGVLLGLNFRYFRDKVSFVLSDAIQAFGFWVEQLLAESTGKEGDGLVPVVGEPLADPTVYGDDRVFVYMYTVDQVNKEIEEKLQALEAADFPVVRIELRQKLNLGAEFYRWEFVTAVAGAVMGVNAFDEPNVAESKSNTRDLLQTWKGKGAFGEAAPLHEQEGVKIYCEDSQEWFAEIKRDAPADFLRAFLSLAKAPDYIALLPYFRETEARSTRLQALRLSLRDRLKVATTVGYGPRYLHSTGQLHKGGPRTGVFLIFTADADGDLQIPGEDYGFATLQRAQALGDFRSLNDKHRRVVRIHLGKDIEGGLKTIENMLAS